MSSDDESSSIVLDVSSTTEYSDLDDNDLEELFDSDGEEDEFTGFAFDLPRNMSWEKKPFNADMEPFTLTPHPTKNLPASTSYMAYNQFEAAFDATISIQGKGYGCA